MQTLCMASAAAIWRAPPPLGAVTSFGTELLKQGRGVGRHELVPLGLRDGGNALSHDMSGAPKPPSQGMVKTVSVARHANDGSWV